MSSRVWKGVAVVVVVVLVGFIAYQLLSSDPRPRGPGTSPAGDVQSRAVGEGSRLVAPVAEAAFQRRGITQADARELGAEVGRLFDAYAAPTPGPFREHLASIGLEASEFWRSSDADVHWEIHTSIVNNVRLDTSGIVVEITGPDGKHGSPSGRDAGAATYTMLPDTSRGAGDVIGSPAAGQTVWVHIPAEFRTREGAASRGRVSFRFTQRTTDRAWIITGSEIHGVTPSGPMGSPPVW